MSISHILIHTITVSRRTATGQNDLGEITYSYANIYTNLACRVEQYSPNLDYNESGQRPVQKILVYVEPTVTLLPEDQITFNGEVLGLVREEAPALQGTVSPLHHKEYVVEPV